jgi:NADH-quinone oxidoreductase subunit E
MDKDRVDRILSRYRGRFPGHLIAILHEVQDEFRYLPEEELRYVSEETGFPIAQIYSIANFYNRFSLKPKGENTLRVCLGTACHVKGGANLLARAQRKLGIAEGETTADMKYTLEVVRCIGACSLAPAVVVNDKTHRNVTGDQIDEILQGREAPTTRGSRR